MPGPILHLGAQVLCLHSGSAIPSVPNPRVMVSGQPVATMGAPWLVAACKLPPPAGGPCVTATFVTAALRVLAGGVPVLLMDSQAICAPTGAPLIPLACQMRAVGA